MKKKINYICDLEAERTKSQQLNKKMIYRIPTTFRIWGNWKCASLFNPKHTAFLVSEDRDISQNNGVQSYTQKIYLEKCTFSASFSPSTCPLQLPLSFPPESSFHTPPLLTPCHLITRCPPPLAERSPQLTRALRLCSVFSSPHIQPLFPFSLCRAPAAILVKRGSSETRPTPSGPC